MTSTASVVRRGWRAMAWAGACLLWADAAVAQGRRHAALIVDANSGRVMSESGADEPRYPASLTKMMTLYVVFDLIDQGRLSYNTRITFSEAATRVQPTKLNVPAGGSITVLEAAKALITKSANDASVALAEHVAGSESKFAALMTQTARRIGMKSSTFKNAHGLPDSEQVTTARDMITLGLRLQDDFPKHYPLFATRDFSLGGKTHQNHNTMLLTYEGTDGIKTGYIGSSGFNLVANVKRGDKHVIGVVFGGATAGARNTTMKTLLNMALFKAATVKTRNTTPVARAKPLQPNVQQAAPVAMPPTAMSAPSPVVVARPAALVAVAAAAPVAPKIAVATVAAPPSETAVEVARVRPLIVAPRPPKQAAVAIEPAPAMPILPAPTRVAVAQAVIQTPALAQGLAPQVPAALPPGSSRLNGPAGIAPAQAPVGAIHLQVGAFATKAEADRHLATVQQQAAAVLGRYQPITIEAVSAGKTVFRARFTGVEATAAGQVCNELRRRNIDCMAARPE